MIQLPLGARDADIEQASLLLEEWRIVVRLRERKESILESCDEHDGILEPLRVVQRHQRDGIGVGRSVVRAGDEHRALEKMIERTQADFAQFVDDLLGGAGHQLATLSRRSADSGPLRAKIVAVANCSRPSSRSSSSTAASAARSRIDG